MKRRRVGRPTPELAAEVDRALLRAAAEIFAERGFGGATMMEIADRAAASRQTLYARYPSKEALYEALAETQTDALLLRVAPLLAEETVPAEALVQFGEQFVARYIHSDLRRLHRMVIAEAKTFPHLASAFFRFGPDRGRALLVRYLQAQVRQQRLEIAHVEMAAEQFIGSLIGPVLIRSTLLQPVPLKTPAQIRVWVHAAVTVFLKGHEGSRGRA